MLIRCVTNFQIRMMMDKDAKDGMSAHIFPMGEAKEPLAAPVHCRHLSVWVGNVVNIAKLA